MNEQELEDLCLDWFKELGYNTVNGLDIAPDSDSPERNDYSEVLLTGRVLAALARINPHVPADCLEQVLDVLTKPQHPVLIFNNRAFHTFLLDGVKVEFERDGEKVTDQVSLIDFNNVEANDFLVVNQFTILGTKMNRRPDIVLFINGLPLAVLELKSPSKEDTDIFEAYNQFQTYKDQISDLFIFNEALVISDGWLARVGSLTANQERFMPWPTIKDENDKPLLQFQVETMIRGFFDRELFLEYLRYFVLFEPDGDTLIKKIAGYHQFHAVREAVRATVLAANESAQSVARLEPSRAELENLGKRKGGVVWHTQGSGKSISMVCYAGMLLQQPEMQNPTILVVTDRNDLDGQLFETFSLSRSLLKQTPLQADSRGELRELLDARASGGIIFTTVQKFSLLDTEAAHPVLNQRSNLVVISDEAHRSQYGLKARLNTKTGQYIYGYAKHMRDALPNASFIGFTGTPISAEDKDTRAVFGDYVSIYDIQDAVDDGATVPIYYESRLAKLDINRDEIDKLNREVDEIVEAEELSTREQTKGTWSALEKLVGASSRTQQVAADLVAHFELRTSTTEGKGMIVCMSREICVQLYDALVALKPEWHAEDTDRGALKVIMTGSASDKAQLQPHIYSKHVKKKLEKRFKDPDDPLRLVIVRDMWLTGFDAPSVHTMYVDKPMRGHNLMQAIARVNRVFANKPGGLVVDYIGIGSELKQALKTYTDSKGKGAPTLDTQEAFAIFLEKLDVIRAMFHGFDYSGFKTEGHKLLVNAVNHIFGLEDGKKRFIDEMSALTKAFSLSGTLDAADTYRKEVAFFSAIKAAILKHFNVDKKQAEQEKHSLLKQILDNAVRSEGVEDIFALAGLDKPNIGLLSEEFLEDVRQMPQRNMAVELLEKLLRDEIKGRTRTNVVQEKKYSERLLDTLRRYHNRAIETAQVIEELIDMAKEFRERLARDEALGLGPDEVAFYDALSENESAVRELGDDMLKALAVEVTEKLRNSVTVDWQKRESVRAKLRILVRRTLKRYKYPPDKQDGAVEMVLKQAETLSDVWSQAQKVIN